MTGRIVNFLQHDPKKISIRKLLLLASAFFIAASGLVYELIVGALSSYLLGDSVTQFSLTIGIYMFAMGLGSYLSRFLVKRLVENFILMELSLGLIGGFAAFFLFISFSYVGNFHIVLFLVLTMTGVLVGLEIPILIRILKQNLSLRELVAKVLALDYLGALAGALSVPFLLGLQTGLIRLSLIFGLLNIFVAWLGIVLFRKRIHYRFYSLLAFFCTLLVLWGILFSKKLERISESKLYADPVIFAKQTPYQRIVLTGKSNHFTLFLNSHLQFDSADEYRYHEALVHPAVLSFLQASEKKFTALVLGGGDGLAMRELLKYKNLSKALLIDLDPEMTHLAKANPLLRKQNNNALHDKRVSILNADAFVAIDEIHKPYDVVIIDFPDPSNYSLGKLYSKQMFLKLKKILKPQSIISIQSTSPLFARRSFWCIVDTLKAAGYSTKPYHAYVPSFGEWGFVMFSLKPIQVPLAPLPIKTKFLNQTTLANLFEFPLDMQRPKQRHVQTLNSQILVRLYNEDWEEAVR
ncbi:MAG: polyamine aminopropyltransferase [Candidatus Hydrogenedentota bacterium]|nr:MAG: polyamine aminopropyltransferase [Candidatus Hydrogenedentota bacterium]